ncbi:hypothetical protein [Pseudomonas sp. JL3]|uniref:hypothetical protein n=1 Tax=Pseudomonas sp. JL3 TaxID=2919943 RepID=UPI0028638200|nr:hypothetical protein [Pseudomonas sp. JL3]MDR8367735.1 hypothetical protein [Pseudomonas sp. JL3]
MEKQTVKWYWILPFLCLAGCDSAKNEGANEMKNEAVNMSVELGSPVETLLKKGPLEFTADCLDAVNMCWYEIRRGGKDQALMNVTVTQPDSSLEIKQVVGLNVVVDGDVTQDVEEVVLTLRGLPDNSSHEENKKLVYKLISDLKVGGWRKYYFPSDPRISSSELNKFDWKDDVFGGTPLSHPLFDPDHEMSLDDWLAGDGFYDWYLYSGHYISHIKVQRRNSATDPSRTGVYLVKIEFKSLDNFWRTDFEEAVRPRWKELFPAHLQQLLQRRSETEDQAQAAGVKIDESYKAPIMEQVR